MKKLFLLLFAFAAMATINAQSLKLGINGKYIESNSEMYYYGTLTELSTLKVYFQLTNTTNEAIEVEGNYTLESGPDETVIEWCAFNQCVLGPISASAMEANATEGLDKSSYINVTLESNNPATGRFVFNIAGDLFNSVAAVIHFINRETCDTCSYENDTIIFVSGGTTGDVPGWEENGTPNEKLTASQKINVYPNPATDNATFDLGKEKGTLTIYSTAGKVIYKAQGASGRTQVSVKEFASGIYFYSFESVDGKTTGKLVVK
jgi:hypothetical protein